MLPRTGRPRENNLAGLPKSSLQRICGHCNNQAPVTNEKGTKTRHQCQLCKDQVLCVQLCGVLHHCYGPSGPCITKVRAVSTSLAQNQVFSGCWTVYLRSSKASDLSNDQKSKVANTNSLVSSADSLRSSDTRCSRVAK